MAGVRYEVEDCSSLLQEARADALADAQDRAALQAALMNVSLGDITGSRDVRSDSNAVVYGIPLALSSCSPGANATKQYAPFNLPSFDPTAEAEVIVTMSLDVSFETDGSTEATPVT